MSVFRRRFVFRDSLETFTSGSLSLVTATTVAAVIVFAGTAAGSTTASTGDATGAIVFGGGTISSGTLEVSVAGSVVIGGSATGAQRSFGAATGTITLAGIARSDAVATGAIVFGGSATVGSVFTMNATGAIVFTGTAAPTFGTSASGSIVFGGALGAPVLSGGIVTSAASGLIRLAGTAAGAAGTALNVPDQFHFETAFNAVRGAVTVSNTVTIMGNAQPAIVVVTGGEYSLNGVDFYTAATLVSEGATITLRHTASDEYATNTVTTLNLSGVSAQFVSVTLARPQVQSWKRRAFSESKRRVA